MDTPDFPPVPFDCVTELRIHGVSGTPTESMLQNAHPVQVWGDRAAGFYRPAHDHGPPDTVPPARPKRALEAYSWGGLTAGTKNRATWLLLLPFMLLNVAAWAHPVRRAEKYPPVGWMSGALRVLGLALTGALVLAAATLGMDVLAWQCAGQPDECGTQHFYTDFLSSGRLSEPGRRIAIGAVVPLLLLVVMRKISQSTAKNYEEYGTAAVNTPPGDDAPLGVKDLANHRFWNGGAPLARLRALHVTAATAGIAGLVAYAAKQGDTGDYDAVATAVVTLAVLALAAAAVLLASPLTGRRRQLFNDEDPPRAYCVAVDWGPRAAALLLAAAAGYAAFLSERPAAPGRLPGFSRVNDALLVIQVVVLLVLLAATAVARTKAEPGDALRGPMFKGYGAPFLALFGLLLGSAYASGLALRVSDLVGNPTTVGCGEDCPPSPVYLPDEYFWSARGFAFFVLFGVVAAVYVIRLRKSLTKKAAPGVAAEYPEQASDPARAEVIARSHATAMLSDRADVPFMAVLIGACAVTALLWGFWRDADWLRPLTTAGAWGVGFFAIGLVGIARNAYRNPKLRRTVGILWDLGTFWPRSAHPFAPPCYCERTVPEFTTRIRQLQSGGGDVIVSAHSQGTVIAAAALAPLHAEADGLALLTYGSPLQRFYARLFPHFFGVPMLTWTQQMLGGRWVNLYRRSDPIGAPVLRLDEDPAGGRPDRRMKDPAFATPPYAFRPPKTRGHSDYWDDAVFATTVDELAAEL